MFSMSYGDWPVLLPVVLLKVQMVSSRDTHFFYPKLRHPYQGHHQLPL